MSKASVSEFLFQVQDLGVGGGVEADGWTGVVGPVI